MDAFYKTQHIPVASHAAAPRPLSTRITLAGNAHEEVNHQAQAFGRLCHSLTELILLIIPPAVFIDEIQGARAAARIPPSLTGIRAQV